MPKNEPDGEDPMLMVGVGIPATVEADTRMAEAVVEEYLLLGYGRDALRGLFTDPFYRATHRIWVERGPEFVDAAIDRVLGLWLPPGTEPGARPAARGDRAGNPVWDV